MIYKNNYRLIVSNHESGDRIKKLIPIENTASKLSITLNFKFFNHMQKSLSRICMFIH